MTTLLSHARHRVRTAQLGLAGPAAALVLVWLVFQSLNPAFLSADNLVNLTQQSAVLGVLADGLGVLLLLPPVRALIRGYLKQSIQEKITVAQHDLGRPTKRGPQVDTASPVITVEAEVVETSTDRPHRDRP